MGNSREEHAFTHLTGPHPLSFDSRVEIPPPHLFFHLFVKAAAEGLKLTTFEFKSLE